MSRHDWILLCCLSLAIVIVLGLQIKQQNSQPASGLVIEVTAPEAAGLEALSLADLDKAQQEKTWVISGKAGEVKVQYVPGRGIAIIESSCPDQICVHTGFISKAGQSIVCVPNQVMLALNAQSKLPGEGNVDAILR